jgi:hypothetical protein
MLQSENAERCLSSGGVLPAEAQDVVAEFLQQIEQLYDGLIRYLQRTSYDKTEPAAVSGLLQQLQLLLLGLDKAIDVALSAGTPPEQLDDVIMRIDKSHRQCHEMLQSRAAELAERILTLSDGRQRQNAYLQHS